MANPLPWHRTLAWRFFLRTALAILGLMAVVLGVTRYQSRQKARESAEGGIKVAAQVMDKSLESQAVVMDAGLEVFTTYSQNLAYIQSQDFTSVRDNLLENLANLRSDIAVVVRPTGALLSCTTDGHKQDYTDVGIVQKAMHPAEAAQAGDTGPSYRGYFRIDGGTYQGVYHGVARRLQTAGGEFIGVMVLATRLNDGAATQLRRQSMVRLKEGDPDAHVSLVAGPDLSGSTLAAGPDRDQLKAWLAGPEATQARKQLEAQPRSTPVPIRLQGRDQLAILSRMNGANALDLAMAELITVPLGPYLRPFEVIQRAVLAVGLAGMVVALLLALGTARKVTAPLARLTAATAELAEGGRPELPEAGGDEVGTLTRAFRALLGELKAKEELLSALESLRAQEVSHEGLSKVGMSMVDVDATVMVPSASQVAAGGVPMAARRKVTLKEGDRLGERYVIEKILGQGGMGLVLKAKDQQLDEDVALKVIRAEFSQDPTFLDQLKLEIKLARKISHKHVLRTHDFGEIDGIPFVSMEYLKGITLKQLVDDRGALPQPLILRIGRQVAEGLEAAHAVGVVHRDVKPLNVMFDARGDAKLMDFGLAAPAAAQGTDAQGQIYGTPRYMAPEQVRGEQVDPRTDLYALGCVLYELATGEPPYDHPEITEVMKQHLGAPIPDPRRRQPSLTEDFALLLRDLMAKAKTERPTTATEVVERLKLLASGAGETRRG
jgi:HAMP domain-containing protein